MQLDSIAEVVTNIRYCGFLLKSKYETCIMVLFDTIKQVANTCNTRDDLYAIQIVREILFGYQNHAFFWQHDVYLRKRFG